MWIVFPNGRRFTRCAGLGPAAVRSIASAFGGEIASSLNERSGSSTFSSQRLKSAAPLKSSQNAFGASHATLDGPESAAPFPPPLDPPPLDADPASVFVAFVPKEPHPTTSATIAKSEADRRLNGTPSIVESAPSTVIHPSSTSPTVQRRVRSRRRPRRAAPCAPPA